MIGEEEREAMGKIRNVGWARSTASDNSPCNAVVRGVAAATPKFSEWQMATVATPTSTGASRLANQPSVAALVTLADMAW